MRGHESLIAMRRKGHRPGMVFVWCGDDQLKEWADWPQASPHRAHIEVADSDQLAGLDWRCVVGMTVLVQGLSKSRVMSVCHQCLENGAKRVLAAFLGHSGSGWDSVDSLARQETVEMEQ